MKAVDLVGSSFGKWKVLARSSRRSYWVCQCECGKTKEVFHGHLKSGASSSCGCFTYDHHHPLYSVWRGIKVRCVGSSSKTDSRYKNYGGRGIGMSPEWENSFPAFRDWALSSGWESGLSIERKDVDKDYTPDNCTWIPREDQNYNKRNTTFVVLHGKRVPLALEVKNRGLRYGTVIKRLEHGWSVEDALTVPIRAYPRKGD